MNSTICIDALIAAALVSAFVVWCACYVSSQCSQRDEVEELSYWATWQAWRESDRSSPEPVMPEWMREKYGLCVRTDSRVHA